MKAHCPTCLKPMPPMRAVWLFEGKFYCSERCIQTRKKVEVR